MAAEENGARYVDTSGWFCARNRCPAFIGDSPVAVDGLHLTWEFSEEISPLLDLALFGNP